MTICPHCKSTNNNFYYCKGCGKRIPVSSKQEKRKESSSYDFIEEVIEIIDNNFTLNDFTITRFSNIGQIDLVQISKEEGVTLIGSEQWQKISPKQQCSCFFFEIVAIYIISGVITLIGFVAGANTIEMRFQLYASAFLILSFAVWFIIPYFTGFSPIASVLYNCALFTSDDESVKNKAKNLGMMFLLAAVPSIFVVPFLYSFLKSKFSKNYEPLAFSISEIKYLEKTTIGK